MMRFDRFTQKAQEAAMHALEILRRYKHTQVDTEHLFLALLQQSDGAIPQIMQKLEVDQGIMAQKLEAALESAPKSTTNPYGGGQTAQVFITPRLKRVMDVANEEAGKLKDEYISTEHLLLAISSERNTPSANILREANITRERIFSTVEEIRGGQRITEPNAESKYQVLEKYGQDLTKQAKEGKLDPVIGRDAEILRVLAGAQPTHEEQPGADRRGRRGQDRHCGRAGPEDRQQRRARTPHGQDGDLFGLGRHGGGHPLPGRV